MNKNEFNIFSSFEITKENLRMNFIEVEFVKRNKSLFNLFINIYFIQILKDEQWKEFRNEIFHFDSISEEKEFLIFESDCFYLK